MKSAKPRRPGTRNTTESTSTTAAVGMVRAKPTVGIKNDPDSIELREVPENTLVYEISGPLFFAAADKLLKISVPETTNCLIIRMRSVNALDATAMHNLEQLYHKCKDKHVQLILSHVNEQPMKVMQKAGFVEYVGELNFCAHIDDAIKRAEDLQ